MDKRLDGAYSTEEILENLRECNAYYLDDNIYRFYNAVDASRT
ncbi:MAG: hypothetical protein PHR69_00255 [Sphaerochaeta sp.]|nr:hypothetical protein [Sphaerochaeta sp.]